MIDHTGSAVPATNGHFIVDTIISCASLFLLFDYTLQHITYTRLLLLDLIWTRINRFSRISNRDDLSRIYSTCFSICYRDHRA